MLDRVINWWTANIPPWAIIALVVHGTIMLTVAYLILLERKVASWVQDRLGPNRVGLGFGIIPIIKNWKMNGFGQPLADGVKFIVKEDYRPAGADKVLFTIAPGLMVLVIIISIAVLPWGGIRQTDRIIHIPPTATISLHDSAAAQLAQGDELSGEPVSLGGDNYRITYQYPFQIASLNIGVLYILAVLSLSVYGVVIGGWASNNKYSFLGGLRATTNMISYEIPLGLAVLCIVVMYGTLDMNVLVEKQCHNWVGIIPAWNVFSQPLAFIMFLICIHAEANRSPFDTAEAEQELVGGYHTEYSAMRFALFFLGEYAGMITTSAVCVALFFGGWDFPGLRGSIIPGHPAITTNIVVCVLRTVVYMVKTLVIIFVFMWVRWSLPRFRFDQLMMLAWRALIPISLGLLMMTAIVVFCFHGASFDQVGGSMALTLLAANVFTGAFILIASTLIPPAPLTNRRLTVVGSRYSKTPLPSPS
jgi:NADH-quinone oxidoreductase subunit H